jgi:hypothetical protein
MYRLISRRYGSAVLVTTWLSACTGWQAQSVAPERVLQDSQFVRRGVRVTTLDGRRLEIAHPALRADTLTGTGDTAAVAIPLGQVRKLDVRRPSASRTAALVGGSLVGAAAATLGVLCIAFCGYTD